MIGENFIASTTLNSISYKTKRETRQEKRLDSLLATGKIKVTPGHKNFSRFVLTTQMLWRIFYVSIYYYLVPFSVFALSTYPMFFDHELAF
jgi:predicted secreted protein